MWSTPTADDRCTCCFAEITMTRQPVLFVSHGAPTLPLQPGATGALWHELGQTLIASMPPRAILVISAHWDTATPTVSAAAQPETIHDFYGFSAPLYQLQYPAPGAPALAAQIATRLRGNGIATELAANRGLDHGAWVPLRFLRPQADLPVLQLSLQSQREPRWHYQLGQALQHLRDEGVLILASGSSSHNLREVMRGQHQVAPEWLQTFRQWLFDRLAAGDIEALLNYRQQAPFAAQNHPTDEHLLPFFVALGAAGSDSMTHYDPEICFGTLSMDSVVWQARH